MMGDLHGLYHFHFRNHNLNFHREMNQLPIVQYSFVCVLSLDQAASLDLIDTTFRVYYNQLINSNTYC